MAGGNGGVNSQLHELYAQAQAARRQSAVLAEQLRAAQHNTAETLRLIHAAWGRAE
jgi:hypothetical protein